MRKVFEKCIHDVSRNGEIRPYALQVYIRKAVADDLEPLLRPVQVREIQPLRGGQILLRDKFFYLVVEFFLLRAEFSLVPRELRLVPRELRLVPRELFFVRMRISAQQEGFSDVRMTSFPHRIEASFRRPGIKRGSLLRLLLAVRDAPIVCVGLRSAFAGGNQFAPEMTMLDRPAMKKRNISTSSRLTVLLPPLNSFQMNTPHRAAIIGAPCPRA